MFFRKIESKGIAHFSYMIGDGKDLAVIDPVRDIGIYMQEARKAGKRIKYILETHRNEDYVSGSMELGEKTGATIYISAHEDLCYLYGQGIENGFEINIGDLTLRALHTPGHTLGHLSYALYDKNQTSPYMVFTGDCLFMGDVGRTDFYGKENLEKMTSLLYDSIFEKLLPLGDEVLMFPAHGAGSACGESMEDRPYSSLGYEKKYNRALQVSTKKEFLEKFAKMRIKPRYFEEMEELNTKGAPFVGESTLLNVCSIEEIEHSKDCILIDIRSKEAYIGGHIPGSIYLTGSILSTFLGALFKTDEKLLFLTDGNVAEVEAIYWQCRRIGFDNIQGFIPHAAAAWEASGKELRRAATISAVDYQDGLRAEEFLLLDLRKEHEIKSGDPQKNKVHIPLQSLYECYEKLERDTTIYVLCGTSERSTTGYSYLKDKGYNPIIIAGGTDMLRALKK